MPAPVIADTTQNPILDAPAGTITPFIDVMDTDNTLPTSAQTWAIQLTGSNPALGSGSLSDPTQPNNGTQAATGLYTESVTITGNGSNGTTTLQSLKFTPPALAPGQAQQTLVAIKITNGTGAATDPSGPIIINEDTAPLIGGVVMNQPDNVGQTANPFGSVTVTDGDYQSASATPGTMDTATITVPNEATILTSPTGALNEVSPGNYTLSAATPAALQAELRALAFDPAADDAGKTIAFTLAITDVAAKLTSAPTTTNLIIPAPAPVITGISTPQTVASGSTLNTFAGLSVTDSELNATDNATITVLNAAGVATDANGTFNPSPMLSKTGVGTYTFSGPMAPANLASALAALVFNPTPDISTTSVASTIKLTVTDTLDAISAPATPIVLNETAQPPTAPKITGIDTSQTIAKTLTPFSDVTVADAATGAMETVSIRVIDAASGNPTDADGTFAQPLVELSAGVYSFSTAMIPAALTAALDALVFTPVGTATSTIQLTVTDPTTAQTTKAQPITIATAAVIQPPPPPPPPTPPPGECILNGSSVQYLVADNSGSLYVQDTVAGRNGAQTYAGDTTMQFANGVGLFDPTGTAEDVARLYGAALDRAPDLAGLEGWTADIDNSNMPLVAVAADFVASPEFIQDYGSLSDAAFVNQLYLNVLNRPADAAGAQAWENLLASGGTRGAVLLGFAESQEYKADTISSAGDNNNGEVYRLYQTVFDRTPDAPGEAGWAGVLASGATPLQVAQDFTNSTEFQADYGHLSVSDFVTAMYNNALGRAPDATGLQAWVSAIQGGMSEATVALGFADSVESRTLTAGATHANWVFIPS